jgi:50S ribosomal protein L16 3-hydroxylase
VIPGFTLPLSPDAFLRRHWQKAPLLMRGAATGLEHPSPDLLASLALDEEVESRLITGAHPGPWQRHDGPFSGEEFRDLSENDWTLLIQSVDHYLTEVSLLLDSFHFLPGWRLEDIMISYAAAGGSVGPHFDRYDVFLLQARGHRRWKLGPECDDRTPLETGGGIAVLKDMPVQEEYLLAPGDVLYLPPWLAHWGVAEDSDCVTWSVGLRAPDLAEVLSRMADTALESRRSLYGDPHRRPASTPGRLEAGDAADIAGRVAGLLADENLRDHALGQLLSEPRQESLDFRVDLSHIRERAPGAVLVRHGGTRIVITGPVEQSVAWINGDARPLTAQELPMAERLADKRLFHRHDLTDVLSPEGQALLEEWIDDGYFLRIKP